MKNKWIPFIEPEEFTKLPHLLYAGMDTVNNASYYWDGAKRKSSPKCVFQYTIDGCGQLYYNGNTYKVDKGKAFVFDLSMKDSCYFYPQGETKPWNFVYCVFSNFEETVEQLNSKNSPVYNLGEKNILVEKIIDLVKSPESQKSMTSNFKNYSLCSEIIGEMCRIIELNENKKNGPSLITKARNLIYEKRLEPFSLKELSSELGICPEHLCREFKRQLNNSPKRYHERLRAEAICERILHGDESIKEIAQAFGFDDISNFNKFFKKCCSITPGKFKKNSTRPLHDMFNN